MRRPSSLVGRENRKWNRQVTGSRLKRQLANDFAFRGACLWTAPRTLCIIVPSLLPHAITNADYLRNPRLEPPAAARCGAGPRA
jgi:hypothetical protein